MQIEGSMDEFALKYASKYTFRYVDADDLQNIAEENEISSLPTFKIFRNS